MVKKPLKKQIEKSNKTFTFQNFSTGNVVSFIKKINTKKKTSKPDDISTKVIKEFGTFC